VKRKWFVTLLALLISLSGGRLAQAGDIPVAHISALEGKVLFQEAGKGSWQEAEDSQPLFEKDKLSTKSSSSVEIVLNDKSILRLEENSTLEFKKLEEKKSVLGLQFGRVLTYVEKILYPASHFEIQTPAVVVGVRGTEFVVEADEKETQVGVFEGRVGLKGRLKKAKESLIEKGFQTKVSLGKPPHRPQQLSSRMKRLEERFPQLRKRIEVSRERWRRMSPEQKEELRKKFKEWKKLSPEERKRIIRKVKKQQQVSPGQKEKLREKGLKEIKKQKRLKGLEKRKRIRRQRKF